MLTTSDKLRVQADILDIEYVVNDFVMDEDAMVRANHAIDDLKRILEGDGVNHERHS
jgi:hypothetical protein